VTTKDILETPAFLLFLEEKKFFWRRHDMQDEFIAECRGEWDGYCDDLSIEVKHPIASQRHIGNPPYSKRFVVRDQITHRYRDTGAPQTHEKVSLEFDDLEDALREVFRRKAALTKGKSDDLEGYIYEFYS